MVSASSIALLFVTIATVQRLGANQSPRSDRAVPSFIAQFNASEYEFDINIYSPIGTVVFKALFIINPNVTVDYLSFDIMMTDGVVGESNLDGDFLINNRTPPLSIQPPYQSMYLLTITTGNELDTNDTMDITFDLSASITYNISISVLITLISNVTLHKIDPCDECVVNSTCEPQSDGSVNCVCPTGYNETNCTNYIGMCLPNPCMNGGNCSDLINDYICQCTSEYTGENCSYKVFIAQFNASEYEFDVNIYSPIGTVLFEALFIINPNVTIGLLAFDIITTEEVIGEASVNEDFLINGTIPPLLITQAPYQSMYLLTITTGNVLDTTDTMDINFELLAFVNTLINKTEISISNVTLHKIDPCDECVINSTCEPQSDGSVNCVCPAGYNGTNCNNYIGMCIPNPCVNNGTCVDDINGYSCVCADGFTSTNCTVNIDDCDPNPCMNAGSCEDLIDDYMCLCTSGYTGKNCSSEDGSDNSEGQFSVVIVTAAAAVIFILILLVICCILTVVCCKRKKHKATKTMQIVRPAMDSELMRNDYIITDSPSLPNVTSEAAILNSTFIQQDESLPSDAAQTDSLTYSYPNEMEAENDYKEKRLKYLQQIAGKTEVATPDDYENEELYVKMTRHYYNLDYKSIQSKEISRSKLVLLDQIGKGESGRVMKGIAQDIIPGESKTSVAVKTLKEGASENDKKNFLGEAHLLLQFTHPNVLSMLGVVTIDDPVMIILPFMKNGDLRSFLININRTDDKIKLSRADKLEIAVQIANEMEYLASRFYIHRDLAARNILVGEGLHVKIGDFGMSRALAKEDSYYKLSNAAKLPIKWMAIESIDYRKFSTFSDVWSFGVVMWEIFSFGMTPYKGVSNTNLPNYLTSGKRLTKPDDCSDKIYKVMSQCWMQRKERRPTFTELKKEINELLATEGVDSNPVSYVYYNKNCIV